MIDGYYYCLNCHSEITPDYNEHCPFCGTTAVAVSGDYSNEEVETAFDLLNKQQQGLIIVPPCKVGDTVYEIDECYTICTPFHERYSEYSCAGCKEKCDSIKERYARKVEINNIHWIFNMWDYFGKTVFLTREEAEKALEEYNHAAD